MNYRLSYVLQIDGERRRQSENGDFSNLVAARATARVEAELSGSKVRIIDERTGECVEVVEPD